MSEMKKDQKGIHLPDYSTTYIKEGKVQHGISRAGIKTREAANPSSFEEYEQSPKTAKYLHEKVLGEMKQMPKPNLPKSEEMDKGAAHPNVDMKGVHKPVSDMKISEIPKAGKHLLDHTGRSSMGTAARSGNISAAKSHSVLSEMKQMPKPNLPKSEGMSKDDLPHEAGSPEDSAHDVAEEHSSLQEELAALTPEEQAEMLAHLRMLKDKRQLRSPENQEVGMDKADKTKHDRCVEEVSKDPSIDNPHAVCVAAGVEPEKWGKSETDVVKKDFSAREVALEILKKAESMYKAKAQEWDDHKTDERIKDLPMAQTREVLNENDIVNAVSQKLTDNSVQRLKQYLASKKAKKEKK